MLDKDEIGVDRRVIVDSQRDREMLNLKIHMEILYYFYCFSPFLNKTNDESFIEFGLTCSQKNKITKNNYLMIFMAK